MNEGKVCTRQGSPTFLADGYGRSELNLNQYGRGRECKGLSADSEWFALCDIGFVWWTSALKRAFENLDRMIMRRATEFEGVQTCMFRQ